MFDFDATGIPMDQGKFEKKLLPKGWYDWEVIEFTSKDGKVYPMEGKTKDGKFNKVDVMVSCVTPGEFEGERIFHTVTFKPAKMKDENGKEVATPGAGMAVHWLKTLNQSFEGILQPDASQWVGERFRGYTIEDEYMGQKRNKISQIEPLSKVPNAPGSDLPF